MHIPDGYLSPVTCLGFYAVMAPIWFTASRKVEAALGVKRLPRLALASAFVFVIMMFNIPLPGGSTGHIVGGAVVTIVLGPWAGVIALSLALTLQALFFGDGGVLALGANCFNMAFLTCFSAWFVFRLMGGWGRGDEGGEAALGGRVLRYAAPFLAAYVSVNVAALAVGVELGVQPIIAVGPDNLPLYAPYPLSISVPAMVIPHLVFFGPVEGVATALILARVLMVPKGLVGEGLVKVDSFSGPVWVALVVLILLTPLGLLASGTPLVEWGLNGLRELTGFVGEGFERFGGIWKGFMPGYNLPGVGSVPGYVLSALVGSAAVVAVIYLWGRLWKKG